MEENDFFKMLNDNNPKLSNVFIGGTDEGSEGNWYWIKNHGKPISYPIRWQLGGPSGGSDRNCLAVVQNDELLRFNDVSCATKRNFVCEVMAMAHGKEKENVEN